MFHPWATASGSGPERQVFRARGDYSPIGPTEGYATASAEKTVVFGCGLVLREMPYVRNLSF